MKQYPYSRTALALIAGSLFTASLSAQSIIDTANEALEQEDPASQFQEGQLAPVLFEGELEDIGPQYLLLPGSPAHDWFRAILDLQWFNSTNPTLANDNNRRSADLMVATAQIGIITPDLNTSDAQVDFAAGYRYQYFEYGEITGDDTLINGLPVSNSDFRGHTFFIDGIWASGSWKVTGGLRYTSLDNQVSGADFYNETVLAWGVSRDFSISSSALLAVAYDGAIYHTESAAGSIFFRDDFNDRLTHALSARITYRINSKLFLQPGIRVNYADYSNDPGGNREDFTTNIGATLSYYLNKDTVARLFTSYQKRESNGVGISDYSNIDAGIGGSFSYRF